MRRRNVDERGEATSVRKSTERELLDKFDGLELDRGVARGEGALEARGRVILLENQGGKAFCNEK